MQAAGYSRASVEAFAAGLRGEVLRPADAGRVIYNAMIDRRPALIARCAGPADVRRAVAFAAETGLTMSVRGGGHNVSGNAVCDGGLMLRQMSCRDVFRGCGWSLLPEL